MKFMQLLSPALLLIFGCRFMAPGGPPTASTESLPAQPGWVRVGDGMLGGISGCALGEERADGWGFLVVHDNKNPGEPRLGWVTVTPGGIGYQRIPWPAGKEEGVDLEAVSPLPGRQGHFIALGSGGSLFHVVVTDGTASILGDPMSIPAPDGIAKPNYEGLSIQSLGGALLAVWADRGDGERAATLFWGWFDERQGLLPQGRTEVHAPLLTSNRRSISDLIIDEGGVVWASAATDPGNDGPFESTVFAAGTLQVSESREVRFQLNSQPTRLVTFERKTEAMGLIPGASGGLVLGSDDENLGGSMRLR